LDNFRLGLMGLKGWIMMHCPILRSV